MKILILLLFIGFIGCAPTNYIRDTGTGNGYSEQKVQDNIFIVTFSGNRYTSDKRSANYALYRAAELTNEMGGKYFVITQGGTKADQQSYYDSYAKQWRYYTTPTSTLTIEIFKTKPNIPGVMDANQIMQNIQVER